MSRTLYVVDTHALLWFFSNDRRLSRRAGALLERGATGDVRILISTISLAEALRLLESGRVRLRGSLMNLVREGEGFSIVPFDLKTFEAMASLTHPIEIHDRAIAATAVVQDAHLITRDPAFKGAVPTVW